MGTRIWLVIFFILGASWASDSRQLETSSLYTSAPAQRSFDPVLQVTQDSETDTLQVGKKDNVCTLCKEYTAEAVSYLDANKTQEEIIHLLHGSCSKLHSLKEECLVLVDYYAPLFFLEISSIQPGDFCQKINLCEQVAVNSQHMSKNSCELCHYAIAEALMKLKDPDTEGNVISTPATEGTILPGITRTSIIDVARSLGFQVEEQRLTVDELLDADEVFVTGTAVGLSPVGSITYFGKRTSFRSSGVGVVTQQLYTALTRLQMGLAEDSMNWIVKLK